MSHGRSRLHCFTATTAVCWFGVGLWATLTAARVPAPQVRSVRLYVLDCGILLRQDPASYNLTTVAAPHGDMAVGQSPEGTALKFIHRGSYDDLDNTYEAITNYLDDKKLESKDVFIEEYVTDPVKSDASKLVVNVYVLIKTPTAPG